MVIAVPAPREDNNRYRSRKTQNSAGLGDEQVGVVEALQEAVAVVADYVIIALATDMRSPT